MDQKLISNPVFQGLQVPTLEEEPRAKSTVLYANKYSGISEVELTDLELLSVIESTVGISGNNVLVQLKNKTLLNQEKTKCLCALHFLQKMIFLKKK